MKIIRALLCAALVAAPIAGHPAGFPERPVRIVVPFAPGSGGDTSARFFGDKLSQKLGQPVVVENIPGASGSMGAVAVKNAPADGYTILAAGWSAQTVNPITMPGLRYDPIKDFEPIAGLTKSMAGFFVSQNSPYRTLGELVAAARRDGRKLNVGTISAGQQIVMEWFADISGAGFVNVPYKTGSQMMTDLVGNQIDWAIEGMTTAGQLVKAGKIRALAVTGDARHSEFPGIPTVKESGYPDFFSYGWSALYVRAGTPAAVSRVLVDAMKDIIDDQASKDYAARLGSELMGLGPEAMRRYELNELNRFRQVARKAGLEQEAKP